MTDDPAKDVFLTSEERYEVYCVKASERPHLLDTYNDDGTHREDDKNDETTNAELPLTDGCDISGWRSQQLVPIPSNMKAALQVGLGCPMLRRESQLLACPMMATAAMACTQQEGCSSKTITITTRWEQLRDFLMRQPTTIVDRISCEEATKVDVTTNRKTFSRWEEANIPVIVTNCTLDWNLKTWEYDSLISRFRHVGWRFSDTHGAMMSLGTYAKYVQTEGLFDDSPLGVYDSEFGDEGSPMQDLLEDYTAPPCFSEDLFALAANRYDTQRNPADSNSDSQSTTTGSVCDDSANNERPPWRWILMGPPRSGTGLHIDPLWTNAWVTLLEGLKRWILIPPHLTNQLPEGAGLRDPQVPSVLWFRDYFMEVSQMDGVVEILQQPGETVFVPNGWPHLVLNLTRTVAVTHNYASEFGPFERMWECVAEEEPEFAQRWYHGLLRHRPDLANRIKANASVHHNDIQRKLRQLQ